MSFKEIVKIVKEFKKEEIELIEKEDRQYKALERLYLQFKGREEEIFKLVLINALMSYQLQMRGEDYWEKFAEFFSLGKGIKDLREFISSYNRRFLSSKLRRLEKAITCVERVPLNLMEDAEKLLELLSTCLNQRKSSKTVVFAVKMLNYAFKIVKGRELENLDKVSIPLDSRIGKISKDLAFWRELSKETGIPQIKLDALFWTFQNEENLKELPEPLKEKLRRVKKAIKI